MSETASYIKDTVDDYWKPVIETNLTAEEKAVIKAGRKERKEHPENFTPWATVKAEKNSR